MTYKDKLKVEKPELINEEYAGGCAPCPDHVFEGAPILCGGQKMRDPTNEKCTRCWNQEVPETKVMSGLTHLQIENRAKEFLNALYGKKSPEPIPKLTWSHHRNEIGEILGFDISDGALMTHISMKSTKFTSVPAIKNVIFNDPATIIFWEDGTKTVVKATNEEFDLEKGLAMAISKKALGNNYSYFNTFKKWLKKGEKC